MLLSLSIYLLLLVRGLRDYESLENIELLLLLLDIYF